MKAVLYKIFLAGVLLSYRAEAITHVVTASDFSFAPTSLTIQLGDTIRWDWLNGMHTTTSTTIPTGAATWNANLNSASTSFTYVPTVQGQYNYVCTPHSTMGMTASFVVAGSLTVPSTVSNKVSAGPNPASSFIKIQSESEDLQVSLRDISGRSVALPELSTNKTERLYSTGHIAAGLYLLFVKVDGAESVQKIVIEK